MVNSNLTLAVDESNVADQRPWSYLRPVRYKEYPWPGLTMLPTFTTQGYQVPSKDDGETPFDIDRSALIIGEVRGNTSNIAVNSMFAY